jgi:hypothetical protein
MLIMAMGPLPDVLEPGFHCVRTHWIRGFMAFQLVRRTRTMMLVVPTCPESGFSGAAWNAALLESGRRGVSAGG